MILGLKALTAISSKFKEKQGSEYKDPWPDFNNSCRIDKFSSDNLRTTPLEEVLVSKTS